MSIWSYNRGEWAEAYVFLKLLGDGRLYSGTRELTTNNTSFLEIKNIQKREGKNIFIYERDHVGPNSTIVKCIKNKVVFCELESTVFSDKAKELNGIIKNASNRKIQAVSIQSFLESIGVNSIKSPPLTENEIEKFGGKTDIFIRVINSTDNSERDLGFSIKSHLGANPTLLNCGQGTKYIFEINNCSPHEMLALNKLNSVKEQLEYIKRSNSLDITPKGSNIVELNNKTGMHGSGPVFDWNLEHIDSGFPQVVPIMLLSHHGFYDKPASNKISDVVNVVSNINPLNLTGYGNPYTSMFKNFLFASFAGLTATQLWDGTKKVSGGYIDVLEDGTLLFFFALSDEELLTYLYNHTFIDSPARGGRYKKIHEAALEGVNITKIDKIKWDHGDYGYVFEENDDGIISYCLGINFQIRFTK